MFLGNKWHFCSREGHCKDVCRVSWNQSEQLNSFVKAVSEVHWRLSLQHLSAESSIHSFEGFRALQGQNCSHFCIILFICLLSLLHELCKRVPYNVHLIHIMHRVKKMLGKNGICSSSALKVYMSSWLAFCCLLLLVPSSIFVTVQLIHAQITLTH